MCTWRCIVLMKTSISAGCCVHLPVWPYHFYESSFSVKYGDNWEVTVSDWPAGHQLDGGGGIGGVGGVVAPPARGRGRGRGRPRGRGASRTLPPVAAVLDDRWGAAPPPTSTASQACSSPSSGDQRTTTITI